MSKILNSMDHIYHNSIICHIRSFNILSKKQILEKLELRKLGEPLIQVRLA